MKLKILLKLDISIDSGKESVFIKGEQFHNPNGDSIPKDKPILLYNVNNNLSPRKKRTWILVCFNNIGELIMLEYINDSPRKRLSLYKGKSNDEAIEFREKVFLTFLSAMATPYPYYKIIREFKKGALEKVESKV